MYMLNRCSVMHCCPVYLVLFLVFVFSFFSYSSFVYLFILSAFVEFVLHSQRHVLLFAE